MFLVVFVPASAVIRVARLMRRTRPGGPTGWTRRVGPTAEPHPERSFGFEPSARPGTASLPVRLAAGLVLLVLVDLAAGALLTGSHLMPPPDRGELRDAVRASTAGLLKSPVFANEPWAHDLARDQLDFEFANRTYDAFLVRSEEPFTSRYINTTNRERRSYAVGGASPAKPLEIAFFGGSVMFGVGQRDEHTIPSELVRVAMARGRRVIAHNYGLPGLTAWQEFLLLERLLAAGHHYDAIVFLDGFNEFEVQREQYSPDPTHLGAAVIQGLAAEFNRQHAHDPGYISGLAELATAYRRNSAALRIVDRLTGHHPSGPGLRRAAPIATPSQITDAAISIYARATVEIRALGTRAGIPVTMFWQPRREGWDRSTLDRLPAKTVDVSAVFDEIGDDVYYDHLHTNEVGAHVLADALWTALEPGLAT